MNSLIVATVYEFSDGAKSRLADYSPMIDLWARHLRGPGQFEGDIKLITNSPKLAPDGVGIIEFSEECKDVVDLFSQRILNLEEMDFGNYDRVLHLDLDILSVNSVEPLFACDERLHVASSQMDVAHVLHAGYQMKAWKRGIVRWLSPAGRARGANCCAVSFHTLHQQTALRPWCDTIRQFSRFPPRPPLGDQTMLNLAIYLEHCAVSRYPLGWVQHSNWRQSDEAILWHFPAADRLSVMMSHAII
ncbi:hypothetical protein SH139x_000194 [Planctomycetaceae bacterium SH139]